MPRNQIYQRRRAYVQRQNPNFFCKSHGQPPSREAVSLEYDRLITISQHDRDPAPGKERPSSPGVAITPPLRATPGVNDAVHLVEAFLDHSNPNANEMEAKLAKDPKGDTEIGDEADAYDGGPEDGTKAALEVAKGHALRVDDQPSQPNEASNLTSNAEWAAIDTNAYDGAAPSSLLAAESGNDWSIDSLVKDNGGGDAFTDNGGLQEAVDGPDEWQTIEPTRPRKEKSFAGNEAAGDRGCFNCGKEGHRKADCPEPPKPRGRACHKCGEEGHIARDCPNQDSNAGLGGGDRVCYKCNEPGHISRNCPMAGTSTSENRACYTCGEIGHRASECPSGGGSQENRKPRGAGGRGCHKCGQQGHFARECTEGSGGFDKVGNDFAGYDDFGSTSAAPKDDPLDIW